MTHILNFALREVLGEHVEQKGSLVAPAKLRFDFSHKAPLSVSELRRIEAVSCGWIAENVTVFSKQLDLMTAHRIPGIRAVFGESYPDPVRVVSLKWSIDDIVEDIDNPRWQSTSIELCGGT
jgi:alanyl-tRNA synthetase